MGLRDWITGRPTRPATEIVPARPAAREQPEDEPRLRVEIELNAAQPLIELTGLTTLGAAAVETLVTRRGLADRREFLAEAVLQREPSNPVTAEAVKVLVEGERIGYLPGYAVQWVDLTDTGAQPAQLQLFTVHDGRRRWSRACVWLPSSPPQWAWSPAEVPPLTSAEKQITAARSTERMVDDALAAGGPRADEFAASMVEGRHYLELVEPISELKRRGRFEEALTLCYRAIDGAEHDLHQGRPAPWYFEQAAIVHRKLKQPEQEAAVLKRWLRHIPQAEWADTSLGQRLQKLEHRAGP